MNPGRKEIRNCILFLSGSALLFILFFSFLAAFFTVSETPEKEKMLHSAPVLELIPK